MRDLIAFGLYILLLCIAVIWGICIFTDKDIT